MEFRVPELGEGVYEAELVEWLVRPGQSVQRGSGLAEVMTDKATIELPAPFSGTIDALLAQPGETIEVGQILLRYLSHDGGTDQLASRTAAHRDSSTAPPEVVQQPTPRLTGVSAASGDGNGSARRLVLAAPAVRKMARSLDVDLREVTGSGPEGRVLIDDLGAFVQTRHLQLQKRPRRSATQSDF